MIWSGAHDVDLWHLDAVADAATTITDDDAAAAAVILARVLHIASITHCVAVIYFACRRIGHFIFTYSLVARWHHNRNLL